MTSIQFVNFVAWVSFFSSVWVDALDREEVVWPITVFSLIIGIVFTALALTPEKKR